MIIDNIEYDEKSIEVIIKDPITVQNLQTLDTRKVMNIQLSWSPNIKYLGNATNTDDNSASVSEKIKLMCIGAVVKTVSSKMDEGIVSAGV